ncbi:MAG TPA: DUF1223 domain-containing protein [Casimicrobiaceae bacterium]|jgi:hypothetical protein|nr:DUF1223 domain-containing protein [Casimicrobiaceae bacterium]
MRLRICALAVAAALCAAQASAAPVCHAASDRAARPLIELYTSEGCDSCPPAERWLSSRFAPDARQSAIALAFHVDYWDRLGWVDRFASAQYTARQYESMRANRATFVYTPQVLLQGHDYASWNADDAAAIDAAASAAPAATIGIDVTPGERDVEVHAKAQVVSGAHADAELVVAYADSGLVSDIKAGENRGRRLAHDHVVRALRNAGRADAAGRIDATLTLPRPTERGTHPTLVAFVERPSNGDVLQALAVPLDGCATH